MLPTSAITYFDTLWGERSGQASQDLSAREKEFDRVEGDQVGSQGYAARLGAMLQDELKSRATSLLATLLEVHGDFQSPVDPGVEDVLVDWGARSLAIQLQGLENHFIQKLASFGVGPKYCSNLDQTSPLCQAQIANGVRRHLWKLRNVPMKKPSLQASTPVIHVTGNVGGIFTGNQVSATIHQTTQASPEALVKALEALAEAILVEKNIEPGERQELVSDAQAAAAEMASPQPRHGRITRLLTGISATVGTLGAVKPAMDAVLDLAKAIGIKLP